MKKHTQTTASLEPKPLALVRLEPQPLALVVDLLWFGYVFFV
jgi:hypothetical protein